MWNHGARRENEDGQEATHRGADHREAARSRGGTGQGPAAGLGGRNLEIAEQTYYRWRKEYGGLRVDQAKRLKELEKENARLKKRVADQALDNAILKEVASGNF